MLLVLAQSVQLAQADQRAAAFQSLSYFLVPILAQARQLFVAQSLCSWVQSWLLAPWSRNLLRAYRLVPSQFQRFQHRNGSENSSAHLGVVWGRSGPTMAMVTSKVETDVSEKTHLTHCLYRETEDQKKNLRFDVLPRHELSVL